MVAGVSENAFIVCSEFRSLRTDLKELGAGMEKFEAGLNELSTRIGTFTRTLEDSMPACVKDACAVEENRHLGLVRLSRAMYLLSKQEVEHTAIQEDAEC